MFMGPIHGVKTRPNGTMDSSAQTRESEIQANELYWGSDKSVNQIAEDMDVSKGALYGMIRPLPARLGCPECDQEVVFPNRTARDRGLLACASCGWEGDVDDATSYANEGSVTLPVYEDADDVPPLPESARSWRNRTMAGGALLGAAAGLALVLWARRR